VGSGEKRAERLGLARLDRGLVALCFIWYIVFYGSEVHRPEWSMIGI
jgi:hypothetical protein